MLIYELIMINRYGNLRERGRREGKKWMREWEWEKGKERGEGEKERVDIWEREVERENERIVRMVRGKGDDSRED